MKPRIFIFIGLGLISLIFFLQLFFLFQKKPKAVIETVSLTYTPQTVQVEPNDVATVSAVLSAGNQKKISGVDLLFYLNSFDTLFDSVSFISTLPQNYFTDKLIEKRETVNGESVFRLSLVARKSEQQLLSTISINLQFKTKNQTGQSVFGIKAGQSQIVGPTENNYFEINETGGPLTIGVGMPPPTIGPTTPLSVTPASGSAELSLKVKFQGVTSQPVDNLNLIKATIKVVGNGIEASASAVPFTADAKAVWSSPSPIIFDRPIPAGSGYTIFIKGDKHIQKKICDNLPKETSGGSYHCAIGQVTLQAGLNTLDFTGIILLAGDLPQQDGVVNSYDVTLVRNNLGKTDTDALASADINRDGIVNTQDYSLIIFALSTKLDEE